MVGSIDSRAAALYAQAAAARRQAQALTDRLHTAQCEAAETLQCIHAAWDRAERIRQLWLAARPSRLRYSRYARLQAQLASMPVIEQAKGIIMAQSGWPEEQAFDALRRASQRENIKVRDLAARVVASTVSPAAGPRRVRPRHPATAPGNDAHRAMTG
jgi:AmiR/NasT family two-component response regulator